MPTYTRYGAGEYTFGAEGLTVGGMSIESFNTDLTPEFEASAKGPDGTIKAFVRGPDMANFSASGYLIDEAAFDALSDFTFGGRFFIVKKKGKARTNTDFKKATLEAVSYSNITGPAA